MDEDEPDLGADAVRDELRRIIGSRDFDASKRNRLFLQYVVEEALQGRADRIKAYNIATSVFGRDQGFDPQLDSIVRIEAGRLRRSLEHYYLTGGEKDAIRITIPPGSYVPAFEPIEPVITVIGSSPPAPSAGRRRPGKHGRAIFVMAFEEDGDQSPFLNWLILGFGVVAWRSGDQGTNEGGEQLFAPFAGVVNKLEEPEIDRKLFL